MTPNSWNVAAASRLVRMRRTNMKMLTIAAASLVLVGAQPVLAKGCIRGAAAGGVAGHYIGKGHAVAGAVAGCVSMHHHYAKQAKAKRAAARNGR